MDLRSIAQLQPLIVRRGFQHGAQQLRQGEGSLRRAGADLARQEVAQEEHLTSEVLRPLFDSFQARDVHTCVMNMS